MTEPFVGEIQAFAFSYAPKGWAVCDGSLVAIRSNAALYSLLGTRYGGDGVTTFALPNLVGRAAMSQGQGPGLPQYGVGDDVGGPSVTVSQAELPAHVHGLQVGNGNTPGATPGPTPSSAVIDPTFNGFVAPPGNTTFSPLAIVPFGGGQPHANAQPSLTLLYCIALEGVYPAFN